MNKKQIRVFIVEDDADYMYLICKLLEKQEDIQVVGCCEKKENVLNEVMGCCPDIVLMDLNLGSSSMDGVELSREIRIHTEAKVLILTGVNTPDMIMKVAREAFASGYIFKNQPSLLLENIRALAAGYTAAEYLIANTALECLSSAEKAVFQVMMGGENHLHSSAKTIANQKRGIVKKLGLKDQEQLMHVFRIFRRSNGEGSKQTKKRTDYPCS